MDCITYQAHFVLSQRADQVQRRLEYGESARDREAHERAPEHEDAANELGLLVEVVASARNDLVPGLHGASHFLARRSEIT